LSPSIYRLLETERYAAMSVAPFNRSRRDLHVPCRRVLIPGRYARGLFRNRRRNLSAG
jgi:hypothetical protein